MTKRHLRRSKSLVSVMLWGGSDEFELDKAKNVCQTEILVDLREAILQVARHFQSIDPKNSRVVCAADEMLTYFYFAPVGVESIVVFVSICLSAHIFQKPHVQTSQHFLYMLHVSMAWASSDNRAMRYILLFCG